MRLLFAFSGVLLLGVSAAVAQPRAEQVDPSALTAAAARLGRVIWSPVATLYRIGVDPFVLRLPTGAECPDRTVYCPPDRQVPGCLREGAKSYGKGLHVERGPAPGHRYSPVRLMCSHPSGETWARNSAGTSRPAFFLVKTASPSFRVSYHDRSGAPGRNLPPALPRVLGGGQQVLERVVDARRVKNG